MAPGFENGREELRSQESVLKDRSMPGPDGDSRPLDAPLDTAVDTFLSEQRGLKIEERLRNEDRAGVGGRRQRSR